MPAVLPQVIFAALIGVAAAYVRSLPEKSSWGMHKCLVVFVYMNRHLN